MAAKEKKVVETSENLYRVIVRPLLTERSTLAKEQFNQYAFEVRLDADKGQIKRAVEQLFKVDVEKVRTSRVQGKFRRYGKGGGMRSDWKKAIVTIGKDQKIEIAAETA